MSDEHLALYQYDACPFCARVRMVMDRLGIDDIEIRDTLRDPANRAELIAGGGRATVPCLRIDHSDGRTQWMYESARIVDYLRAKYASTGSQSAQKG
jgi:glutathione S-transferase